MNILLLGSGGREDALAWRLRQSPSCGALIAAPGNPGIARWADCVALDPCDAGAVVELAQSRAIDLVVIGPEAPLVAGVADALRAAGIAAFGPSAAAAQLEGSKGFTKDLCRANGIPTADYVRADGQSDALAALERFGLPVVVKADGLAAGKGVTVATSRDEAEAAIADAGDAPLVIEEFLAGEEASLFALVDGETAVALASAQDHKRVGEGDTGPNTGGMGAYAPAPVLTPDLEARAIAHEGMRRLERTNMLPAQAPQQRRIASGLRGNLRCRREPGGNAQRRAIDEIAPGDCCHCSCVSVRHFAFEHDLLRNRFPLYRLMLQTASASRRLTLITLQS